MILRSLVWEWKIILNFDSEFYIYINSGLITKIQWQVTADGQILKERKAL